MLTIQKFKVSKLSFLAAGKYKITGMVATRQRKQVTKPELKLKIVTD
jgi:hypothetical protein